MKDYKTFLLLFALILNGAGANGQVTLGEIIYLTTSSLKQDADPEAFKSFMLDEFVPAWNNGSSGTTMHLLRADRGDQIGEFLPVCMVPNFRGRMNLGPASPFNDQAASVAGALSSRPSNFLAKADAYTEYQLIGADQFTSLPKVDILGIHYIQVKPNRAGDFEKLVMEKLHPTVGNLVHDMKLLYYKGIAGEGKGSFITIFAITSVEARERFWPTGGPEQPIVHQLFGPHMGLAQELGDYLVRGSYLEPESGGAAAFFESKQWTDYVVID